MRLILSSYAAGRHTANSAFSHYDGQPSNLLHLVAEAFPLAEPGYRNGVLRVPVSPVGFWSGTVKVEQGMAFDTTFAPRQGAKPDEAPFLQTTVWRGPKLPAVAVEIVLYRSDVLAETDERSGTGAARIDVPLRHERDGGAQEEWEIISINARPTLDPEPMDPMTMARNLLGLPGGTRGDFTAREIAQAVVYWSTHARRFPT